MFNKSCLGCHTYFEEGQKVPLESISVEFKNYYLPIKDPKPKWILLKTIVGFLNSKGGTIYIGIQDHQGKVIGQQLSRKQKDQFLLFIKSMADKIIPAVDFYNKEEINIVYVPVVESKKFKGKYIIKIIVKQGDPSKTYHFNQVIELTMKGKTDKYEIAHAFYRHNMGGIQEIKGEALLEEVARKTANPSEISNIFHMFCNPKPLALEGSLTKIGFSGIRKDQLRQKLQELFHSNLQSFDVDYWLVFDIENKLLLICLENEHEFKQINNYIQKNLTQLNKGEYFNFIEKGQYLDFYLYKNIGKRKGLSTQKSQKDVQQNIEREKQVKKESIVSPEEVETKKEAKYSIKDHNIFEELPVEKDELEQVPKQQQKYSKQELLEVQSMNDDIEENYQEKLSKLFEKSLTITVTHINEKQIDELEQKIQELNPHTEAKITKYQTSMTLEFASLQILLKEHEILLKEYTKLSSFGMYYRLVIGANTKKIVIRKYNIKNRKQLKRYIQQTLKGDVTELQFKKFNHKFFLEITLKTAELACQWLDTLMKDPNMDNFIRPGSENNIMNRLRMYLFCKCD